MSEPILFQLNPRLAAAAAMVRRGKVAADIGTDHAYLPIWLIKSGKCPRAIATDLREGPLARASHNAYRYRVQQKLSLRHCNGLDGVAPDEADDIIVAGMGGELISSILARAQWLKDEKKQLILQPMSSAEDLRRYLHREGFSLLQEEPLRDAGRVYTVMRVRYTGEKEPVPAWYWYIGRLDPSSSDEAREYTERQLRHLKNVYQGYCARGEREKAEILAKELSQLSLLIEGEQQA